MSNMNNVIMHSVSTLEDLRRFLRLIDLMQAQGDDISEDSIVCANVAFSWSSPAPVKNLAIKPPKDINE